MEYDLDQERELWEGYEEYLAERYNEEADRFFYELGLEM